MSSREMQLVSRIVTSGDLDAVIDWGITSLDFLTREGRALFNHIVGYYNHNDTKGAVIGPQVAAQLYPYFVPCDDPGMTTKALCAEVRKERLAKEGLGYLDNLRTLFESDPQTAIHKMQTCIADLQSVGFGKELDMSLGAAYDSELTRYSQLESGMNLSCGPWPWEPMQTATGGFQPDDYIVLYGRPKSFKSWILTYLISWVIEQGKRAIIYTKEMTSENIFRRIIACIAHISYEGLRMGTLTPEEKDAFYAAGHFIQALQASHNVYSLSGRDAPAGGDTVPWLRSKAKKFKPDFIFIDGMYLMSDIRESKKENERVKSISRDLSDLRLELKIPIIVTVQANRAAAKNQEANLDEIAFSDALGQDATCVFRVISEQDKNTCMLVMGGAREYRLNGFRVYAEPAYNFTLCDQKLTRKDIDKAIRNDTGAEDNPEAHVVAAKIKKQSSTKVIKNIIGRLK